MRYLLTALLLLLTGCDDPPEVCSPHVDIEGDYPAERIERAADHACQRMTRDTPVETVDLSGVDVKVRVYGPGESTRCTDTRSGTCTVRYADGSYHVDVRQEPHGDARPSHVDDRIEHEIKHVVLWEHGIRHGEHHKWMLIHNVCGAECQPTTGLEEM